MTELPSDKASTGNFSVTSDLRSRLAALATTSSGVAAEAHCERPSDQSSSNRNILGFKLSADVSTSSKEARQKAQTIGVRISPSATL
jgi:hypothetical protein